MRKETDKVRKASKMMLQFSDHSWCDFLNLDLCPLKSHYLIMTSYLIHAHLCHVVAIKTSLIITSYLILYLLVKLYHQSPKPIMISINIYHLACAEGCALQWCSFCSAFWSCWHFQNTITVSLNIDMSAVTGSKVVMCLTSTWVYHVRCYKSLLKSLYSLIPRLSPLMW